MSANYWFARAAIVESSNRVFALSLPVYLYQFFRQRKRDAGNQVVPGQTPTR
jgi:hypothetical protein